MLFFGLFQKMKSYLESGLNIKLERNKEEKDQRGNKPLWLGLKEKNKEKKMQ